MKAIATTAGPSHTPEHGTHARLVTPALPALRAISAPRAHELIAASGASSARNAGAGLPTGAVGHALGRMRVRAVAEDAPRARSLRALAYTVEDTIHLPPGLEHPRTLSGREILAHEVIHAQQWHNGRDAAAAQWSSARLEDEAHTLAPRIARGEPAPVVGVHRGSGPLLHPIFISTHGDQDYLSVAERFYVRWGYGTPTRVGSIEEMLENLSRGSGPLSKVTLVSHAVPSNVNISFLRGGAGFVLESDWDLDSLGELPQLAQHVTSREFRDRVFRALLADRGARTMLDALGLQDVSGDPLAMEYVWWLLDAWFLRNQRARTRGRRRQRATVVAAADARAQTYRDALSVAMAATAGLGSGGGGFSFSVFEQHFARVLQDFSPGATNLSAAGELIGSTANQAVDRILGATARGTPTFFDHLESVRNRLTDSSHIEVQGCRVGRQASYLAAMGTFFNGALVTAPDWFQIFGHIGYRLVTGDDDRTMRGLWRERPVRRALAHWAPIITGDPLPDTPGWEDLAAYLRAGHPLIVGRRLLLTRPMSEHALLEFLARQGYRITAEDELREEFVEGRRLRDAVNFALIDWLQENRNGRGGLAFRPDPAYQDHIKSSR